MPSEEFHRIMADLREREKRLYDNLAALEGEGRAVVRDHRELLVAIENDQGPTHPPQHPVAEALNAFHSTQFVEPPAVASGAEVQPVEDEDSLFIPGESGESRRVSGNAEESLFISESAEDALPSPQHAKNSLSVPEDTRIEEPTADPRPRPKRRVTFSDAPDTIFGAMSPFANFGSGDAANTDELLPVQSPSGDAHINDNEPVYIGNRHAVKRARHFFRTSTLMPSSGLTPTVTQHDHVNATQESLPPPVTSDDTNMSFEEPVYNGIRRPSKRVRHFSRTSTLMPCPAFATIASEDDHVNAARESPTLPINAHDTMMGFDQPIYAGNRRPVKRVGHSSRTSILMHNTGFTPNLPDNKPASDPQSFVGTYDHQDLVKDYNVQNLAGIYNPQDFDNNYNAQDFAGSYNPPDYTSNYDPNIPAGGLVQPWQGEQYNDMTAESKLPDHGNSHFVCPYPDCGKLYVDSVDVEQHLKHHHPDWALIKDAVTASDSM
ncbi:uncharacterized protein M437DRAFT_69786 [Aureobasidium melanogenum CBS 110374]|uniref:C2H2-type domain-containing protein n=1 Tax=Aureobasidium melanogenum (strain CBS 110374) TaxID=1043003 RepID=A0A074VHX8_AURM1|nr:uncharacterized protein M437DRAFT_69786 [Aureobasidium melanogenum CBS 110374]KEQ58634.1 hypothetical protein M437DRAFT_69786 [Aureobasidium melanogenum CBS 110374]